MTPLKTCTPWILKFNFSQQEDLQTHQLQLGVHLQRELLPWHVNAFVTSPVPYCLSVSSGEPGSGPTLTVHASSDASFEAWLIYAATDKQCIDMTFEQRLDTTPTPRPQVCQQDAYPVHAGGGGSYNYVQDPALFFKGNISVAAIPLSSLLKTIKLTGALNTGAVWKALHSQRISGFGIDHCKSRMARDDIYWKIWKGCKSAAYIVRFVPNLMCTCRPHWQMSGEFKMITGVNSRCQRISFCWIYLGQGKRFLIQVLYRDKKTEPRKCMNGKMSLQSKSNMADGRQKKRKTL